jgi:hypothetical protein
MELIRSLFADMGTPRTLTTVIYVLAFIVAMKAISVYFGFDWATALAAQW